MNFDHVETCGSRAFGRHRERLLQGLDLVNRQLVGLGIGVAERDGARGDRTPSAGAFRNGALSRPRPIGASLSTRMGELDAGACTLIFHKARNTLKRLEMLLAPDAKILRRNAALGCYRGGLREYQGGAADRPSGKMHEMPIIGVAVDRRILAHWRDDNAVGELYVAHAKFAKQMRHGSIVSIENGRVAVGGAPTLE